MILVGFDWLLIGILVLSALLGAYRGFVREALALSAWVIAIWSAWRFGDVAAGWLPDFVSDPVIKLWAARLLMLITALFVVGIVSRLLSILMEQTGLSGTNRLLGAGFGLARGYVLAAVIVALLQSFGFDESPWWNESKLIPYAAPIADRLVVYANEGLELLQESPILKDPL